MKKILFITLILLMSCLVVDAAFKRDVYDYQGSHLRQRVNYSLIDSDNMTADYILVNDMFANGLITGNFSGDNGAAIEANRLVDIAIVEEVGGVVKGQILYKTSVAGTNARVSLADNTGTHEQGHPWGLAAEDGAKGDIILVILAGQLKDVNTSGFTSNCRLHLSTNGTAVCGDPPVGIHVEIGEPTKINPNTGIIQVTIGEWEHTVRGSPDFDVEIGTGTNNESSRINFKRRDRSIIGYMDGEGDFNWDNNTFYIDNSTDSVGVGTDNPSHKLSVNGSVNISGGSQSPGMIYDPTVGKGHFGYGTEPNSLWFISHLVLTDSNFPNTMARYQITGNGTTGVTAFSGTAVVNNGGSAVGMSFIAQISNSNRTTGIATKAASLSNALRYTKNGTYVVDEVTSVSMAHLTRGNWVDDVTVNVTDMNGLLWSGFNDNFFEGNGVINIENVVAFRISDSTIDTAIDTGVTNIDNQIGLLVEELDSAISNIGVLLEDDVSLVFGTDKDFSLSFDSVNSQALFDLTGVANTDFNIETTGDANSLFIEGTNGNVGIGTNTPDTPLEVVRDIDNSASVDDPVSTLSTSPVIMISNDDNTANSWGALAFKNRGSDYWVFQSDWGGVGNRGFRIGHDPAGGDPFLEVMRLTEFGNVGIGTIPTEKLHVEDGNILINDTVTTGFAASPYKIQLTADSQRPPFISFTGWDGAVPATGSVSYDASNSWFLWSGGGFNIGTVGAKILWGGAGAPGFITRDADGIQINGRDGIFLTTKNDDTGDIIMEYGNVGIGTSTPGAKLEIITSSPTENGLIVNGTSNNLIDLGDGMIHYDSNAGNFVLNKNQLGVAYFFKGQTDPELLSMLSSTDSVAIGDSNSMGYKFRVDGNVSLNDTLYVNNGNVGIGTSTPSEKLQVLGIILMGEDSPLGSGVVTDEHIKQSILAIPNYDLDRADVAIFNGQTDGSDNLFRFGGGSATHDAMTDVEIWTGERDELAGRRIMRVVGRVGNTHRIIMNDGDYDTDYRFFGSGLKKVFDYDYGTDDLILMDAMYIDGATDRVGIGTPNPSAKLDVNGSVKIIGDLNQSGGNATINMIYGEMWNYTANISAWTFPIASSGVYYNLTNLSAGDLNGFTHTSNSQVNGGSFLTALVAGKYKLDAVFSTESVGNNQLYAYTISKNHDVTQSRECYSRRFISIQSVVASASVSCIVDLDVGDILVAQIENEGGTSDIKIHAVNVNAWRIGN